MQENIIIKNKLDEKSILLYYEIFNKINNSQWTLEQFKQSLRNQEYLNHFVFYQNSQVVALVEYSINNPWNKKIFDIIYITNKEMEKYIIDYIINKIPQLKNIIKEL